MKVCILRIPDNVDIADFKKWLDGQVHIVNALSRIGLGYENIIDDAIYYDDIDDIKIQKGDFPT